MPLLHAMEVLESSLRMSATAVKNLVSIIKMDIIKRMLMVTIR